jgi:peptidoglycan/LPS O-acetylase OafA/YrhL
MARNEKVDSLKGFFILSVILAHINVLNSKPIGLDSFLMPYFDKLGLIGVVGFFIISGYYFYTNTDSGFRYLIKKIQGIIIPWLSCSFLTFCYMTITQKGWNRSFKGFVFFLLGVNSIYYYVPVLLFFYLLFWYIKKYNNKIILLLFGINISVLIYFTKVPSVEPYLNPCSWIFFFSLGIYFKQKKKIDEIHNDWISIAISILSLILVCSISVLFEKNDSFGYFKLSSLIIELIGVYILYMIVITYRVSKCFALLGKYSFTIYLLHLPVINVINIIYFKYNIPLIISKYLLAIIIIYLVICLVDKCKKCPHWLHIVFGIRK